MRAAWNTGEPCAVQLSIAAWSGVRFAKAEVRWEMTIYLVAVVLGWGFLLDRLVKQARLEVGIEKASSSSSNIAVFMCWIPIISMIGICLPRLFLGNDLVQKLNQQGIQGRWFNRIRISACAYLVLLFGMPILFVLAARS